MSEHKMTAREIAESIVEDPPMVCLERHYGPGPYTHAGCLMGPDWTLLVDRIEVALVAAAEARAEQAERDRDVARLQRDAHAIQLNRAAEGRPCDIEPPSITEQAIHEQWSRDVPGDDPNYHHGPWCRTARAAAEGA